MTDQTPPTDPGQLAPLQLVAPGPLAFAVSDGHAPDGARFVMLRFEHPTGSSVYALPIDFARQVATALNDTADAGPAQGLVVPTLKVPAS